jgi:hypothetical protein
MNESIQEVECFHSSFIIPHSSLQNFAPRRPESRTGRFFVQLAHGVRHRAQADDPFVSPA